MLYKRSSNQVKKEKITLVGRKEKVGCQVIHIKPVMLKDLSIPIIHTYRILEPAQTLSSSDILPCVHSHHYMKVLVAFNMINLLCNRPVTLFIV